MKAMNDLASRLKMLKDTKSALSDAIKTNNEEIEQTEAELFNLMIDEGNDSFELNGYKFSLQYKDIYSSTIAKREQLLEALKMYGIDRSEIITETIPAPKLNSIMKSICQENDEELPEEFTDIVSLYTKQGVAIRKVTGKGGKSKSGKAFTEGAF